MDCFALKTDQQGLEFVNPGEGTLAHKAIFVHHRVEMAFASALHVFAIALVFRNIGFDTAIPQQFACFARIKRTISIEIGAMVVQTTAFHIIETVDNLLFEIITVIMLPCKYSRRGNNVPVRIGYWQDVTGLSFLSPLIADGFAPFFAALWLPSRLSTDKFNSPRMERILASKRRCKLPSLLHLRK